jgi:hypothetical protein
LEKWADSSYAFLDSFSVSGKTLMRRLSLRGRLIVCGGNKSVLRDLGPPRVNRPDKTTRIALPPDGLGSEAIGSVTLGDDLGTTYSAAGSLVEAQPAGEYAASSFFTPASSRDATSLSVSWHEQTIRIDLAR